MSTFVDTSAFFGVLDTDDEHHDPAVGLWTSVVAGGEPLVTTSYVLLETCALVQRRLGIGVLRRFCEEIVPILDVEWVGRDQHDAAVTALLAAGRKGLSLVD